MPCHVPCHVQVVKLRQELNAQAELINSLRAAAGGDQATRDKYHKLQDDFFEVQTPSVCGPSPSTLHPSTRKPQRVCSVPYSPTPSRRHLSLSSLPSLPVLCSVVLPALSLHACGGCG